MPAKIIDTIERDGKTIWVYDNGMEKDASNGHIVKPPPATLITDSQKSTELHRARQEKKRAIMIEAANEAVSSGEFKERYGDLAFVAEITKAAMQKAKRVADPKQIEAARFVMQETGLSLAQEQTEPAVQQSQPRLYLLIAQLHERQSEVVNGLVTETDISVSNNVRIGESKDSSPTDKDGSE
jgi:hypothetical protein